jgi:Raf kinase inhibitor-like YbhB/YbcL family protein
MKKQFFTAALVAAAAFGAQHAVAEGSLSVKLAGLTPEGNLPLSTAFCLPPGMGKPGDESPGIRWSAGPAGTKSYVIISTDPDVVRNLSLMNKPGVTIPADAPRMNIYHWVLIDIPAIQHHIPPGGDGAHFVPGGKPIGQAAYGVRGTNDYWPYFNKRPGAPAAMKGPYGGFDGPCPPKNDLLVHDYKFQVFALDVAKLPLSGQFFAPAVFKAMQGHVLAQGEADAKFTFSGK